MRFFLSIGIIDKIDLFMANIKEQLFTFILCLGYFIVLKNILYIKKSVANQQIIFNKNIIILKKSSMINVFSSKPAQIINKIYITKLPTLKILKIIKA